MAHPLTTVGRRHRITRVVLVAPLMFGALWVSSCAGTPEPTGDQIVVVGDSYTMGPNDDPNDPNAWPGLTWKRLRAEGYSIAPTVSGEGGAGYAHPGHKGETFAEKAETIKKSSELVVFFGSANDMTVPPVDLKQAVHDTLTKARGTAREAHFVVIGPAWPRSDVPKEVFEVRDIVRDEAVALGATFVDPLEQRWLWDRPNLIGPDGIHPNRAGQLYLSEKLGPLVEAQLSKSQP